MGSELMMSIASWIILFIFNIFILSMHLLHMHMRELQKEHFKKEVEEIIKASIMKVEGNSK